MRKLAIAVVFLASLAFCAEPVRLSGRIAAYHWYQHEQTGTDTFVLKLADPSDVAQHGKYVLVVYKRHWGFDAPNFVSQSEIIPRLAFLGRGHVWQFSLVSPDDEQNYYCDSLKKGDGMTMQVEDEDGVAKVPMLVATPGTDPKSIPPISTMKCLVLVPNGWAKLDK